MPSIESIGTQTSELLTNHQPSIDQIDKVDQTAVKPKKGKTLEELYPSEQLSGRTIKKEKAALSFLGRCMNILISLKKTEKPIVNEKTQSQIKKESIDFAPCLEVPANIDPHLLKLKLPKLLDTVCSLGDEEVFEGLSKMSDQTMHRVMMIVLAAQNELNRDGSLLNIEDMERLHKMQNLRQKDLQLIKDALKNDDKILGYFNTVQNFAVPLSTIAALASKVSVILAVVGSTAAIISTAGKCYFNWRSDKNKAKFTELDHELKMRSRQIEGTSDRLQELMQTKNDQLASELLKGLAEMTNMINQ